MSTSGVSLFSGNSRYASDFQTIIDRSVAFASLPLQQIQNDQNHLNDQNTGLNTLNSQFAALQAAIANLASSSGNLHSSSVSDGTVLSASVGADALPGTYTVAVASAGAFSSVVSASGLPVTDPATQNISSATSFTLTVGGVPHTIIPSAATLSSLANAINADSTVGVQATIVNIGSPSAPDYRLSLQTNNLGNISITLGDGTTANFLGTVNGGSLATYQVNGQPATPISSDSRSVTIAPGVTVSLLKVGSSSVTVTPSAVNFTSALSSFVSAFNATAGELDKSRGKDAGALAGQGIVYSLSRSLSDLGNYTGTGGAVNSLADLGLGFDSNGKLTLDSTVLANAGASQIADVSSFLGSATGGGFLQAATDSLNSIEDPTTGYLATAINANTSAIAQDTQLISDTQDRIDLLHNSLNAQMAASDALIASLEQQATFFAQVFQATYNNSQQTL